MTVMETVRDMAAAGSAVVMVCHDMEVVSDFADRLVVMANGEILGRGTCADVFANDGLMQRAFVEPPRAIALAKRLAAEVSPAFAGLSEVSDIARRCEGVGLPCLTSSTICRATRCCISCTPWRRWRLPWTVVTTRAHKKGVDCSTPFLHVREWSVYKRDARIRSAGSGSSGRRRFCGTQTCQR